MPITCNRISTLTTFVIAIIILTTAVTAFVDDYDDDMQTLRSMFSGRVTKEYSTDDDPPSEMSQGSEEEDDDTTQDLFLRYPPPEQNSVDDSDVIRHWLQTKRANTAKTNKRSPSCMRKCIAQRLLHPAQCHSLC